ncbi:MAG: MerR family transcriptional regulator [Gammaproteobacteria bacterium]
MKARRPSPLTRRFHRVREVSTLTGVSVRTLHYYDELGLLTPRERTPAGYRLYSDEDILKLQKILIQRELGFPLDEIRRSFEAPDHDHRQALLKLRITLEHRARHTSDMMAAVDRAIFLCENPNEGSASDTTLQELFIGFDPARYASEAEQRWGTSAAWRISKERTRRYTPADWQSLKHEQDAILSELAQALQAHQYPNSRFVRNLAERHRLFNDHGFYPCSREQHVALARLYESDQRFRKVIDRHEAGLTPYLIKAIRANAKRRAS